MVIPQGWHASDDHGLVCPHRDTSVCPDCDANHPEAVDVLGMHLWVPDPTERETLARRLTNE